MHKRSNRGEGEGRKKLCTKQPKREGNLRQYNVRLTEHFVLFSRRREGDARKKSRSKRVKGLRNPSMRLMMQAGQSDVQVNYRCMPLRCRDFSLVVALVFRCFVVPTAQPLILAGNR